ncbi:Hypothetical predicted protein [Lecanosticta acicola]|uniref:Uncharacterized protein n=1 Tax=Lecanosticta acicola TaxID=111012 RepID=A0AAI8YUL5_9PEZI|nr:Hypothetical predicted protein [Lecanosticta acicola]
MPAMPDKPDKPDKPDEPDKPDKPDAKPAGLRAFFQHTKRKASTSQLSVSSEVSSGAQPKQQGTSNSRTFYRPRHAERDMMLSMPVTQRPNLVAKAQEARLQHVCTEIGFNTASPSTSGRQRPLEVHPKLHMHRYSTMDLRSSTASLGAPSSSGWCRSPGSLRSVSSPIGHRDARSIATIDWAKGVVPGARPVDPTSDYASHSRQVESGNKGLVTPFERATTEAEDSSNATHRLLGATCPTRQRPAYFSHHSSIPNLRARSIEGKGKGKGRAAEGDVHYNGTASLVQQSGNRDSDLVRHLPSPSSSSHRPLPTAPTPPSDSSVTDSSVDSGNTSNRWSVAASRSQGSISTIITRQTEYTEQGKATTNEEQEEEYPEGEEPEVKEAQTAIEHKASVVSDANESEWERAESESS